MIQLVILSELAWGHYFNIVLGLFGDLVIPQSVYITPKWPQTVTASAPP